MTRLRNSTDNARRFAFYTSFATTSSNHRLFPFTLNATFILGQKSKQLILSEYANKFREDRRDVNKQEQLQKKMKHCLIFSREIFYVTVVLCLNILWLKAVNDITARQTRTSLCKHDVIKICSIEYLTTQIELLLPAFFQLPDRSQNYRIFNVRAIV